MLELLQDAVASSRLSGQELATISDRILEVQWFCGHLEPLLAIIAGKSQPKRRKQQDYLAATNYLSNKRWTRFLDPDLNLNARADFFLNFVVSLDCINPTEPTVKMWASETLCAHFKKDVVRSLKKEDKMTLPVHEEDSQEDCEAPLQ